MNIKHISVAGIAGISLLCSSCVVGPYDGYGTFTYSTNGHSSSVAWTSASYDANGFPIYGYSYGRPVYGYTADGAAIFTIAALTALCFVPDWGPAPWYHGHWHYPHHIHRVSKPPRYAHGHHPHIRPHGAPHHHSAHHRSGAHFSAPVHHDPSHHGKHAARPGNHAARPGNHGPSHRNMSAARPVNHAPNHHARNMSRPSHSSMRVQHGSRANRVSGSTRPAGFSHHRNGGHHRR